MRMNKISSSASNKLATQIQEDVKSGKLEAKHQKMMTYLNNLVASLESH